MLKKFFYWFGFIIDIKIIKPIAFFSLLVYNQKNQFVFSYYIFIKYFINLINIEIFFCTLIVESVFNGHLITFSHYITIQKSCHLHVRRSHDAAAIDT